MKKIIISVIFLLTVLTVRAQCTLDYKALSAFNKDTTAFMKYNFKDRADCYKGKTVSNIISDLGIPVKSYTYNMKKNKSTNGVVMVTAITLFIYDGNLTMKKLDSRLRGNNDKLSRVRIFLETPLEHNANRSILISSDNDAWTTQINNFFATKKVSEIKFIE